MRTIAIGDIHGCVRALSTILDRVPLDRDDLVVFLGDYIDRGPDTRGVIDQILKLCDTHQVITLRGNHEAMLLESLRGGPVESFWIGQCGGNRTLASYGGGLQEIPAAHLQFFEQCRRFHETDTHLFVHANYGADEPLDEQPDEVLLWQHLSWSVPERHQSGKQAVVGHTPQRSGKVLDLGHLRCIDTACFAGGWLTALDVMSGRYWQANEQGAFRECTELEDLPPVDEGPPTDEGPPVDHRQPPASAGAE
ncbi:MAG: metallophosphoesterase family protein [Pirellulales bacterium]